MNYRMHTLAELLKMLKGKQAQEWSHTAPILSFIHNGNCSAKKDMRTVAYFNPFATEEQKRLKRPGDVPADTSIFKKLLPIAIANSKNKSMKPPTGKRVMKTEKSKDK